jgi:hypothetical protein
LSVTFNVTLCFHFSLNSTVIILLSSSVSVISLASEFEKYHSYESTSYQFEASISVDAPASKINSDGNLHLLVGVIENCGVGGVEST